MYPHYKFQMVPIVIGALGYVPKCLEMSIHQLGFNKIETEKLLENYKIYLHLALLRYAKPS